MAFLLSAAPLIGGALSLLGGVLGNRRRTPPTATMPPPPPPPPPEPVQISQTASREKARLRSRKTLPMATDTMTIGALGGGVPSRPTLLGL